MLTIGQICKLVLKCCGALPTLALVAVEQMLVEAATSAER